MRDQIRAKSENKPPLITQLQYEDLVPDLTYSKLQSEVLV